MSLNIYSINKMKNCLISAVLSQVDEIRWREEYIGHVFQNFLKAEVIVHEAKAACAPKFNDQAGRLSRKGKETPRLMLLSHRML